MSISNRKYKLIKCFPGSPPINTIVRQRTIGYQSDGGCSSFFNEDIENYPEFWEKIFEKPIFITEDEVCVFKPGNFFTVDTDTAQDGGNYLCWIVEKLFIKDKSYLPIGSVKIFSTEKAAKDWIDLNKPMYSKRQILDAALVKYITGTILLHIKDIK